MRRALVLLASLVLLCSASSYAADRYDPRLRFQTISTSRFDIHYHQGEESQARRLAALAESVAAKLDATLGTPSGRVQVILVNQTDLSNGWATPVPYNTIEIVASSPDGDTLIGNTSDWLRMVFIHEYTHVVHLSQSKGWIGGLQRVFGRLPVLYPNLYLPTWQIEGIAVYEESALTGEGRIPDGNFHAIIDVAAAASRLEPLDRVNGGLVDWPGGNAAYAYGSNFHQFLADKYGAEALQKLTAATSGRVPYLGSPAFKKIFKRSLGDLWRDFESSSAKAAPVATGAVVRLTHHGFEVTGPRFAADGRVYYSVADPHEFPALMSLGSDETTPRKIAERYLGRTIGVTGSTLIFDQLEMAAQVALQSDLYSISTTGGRAHRLTHGMRAADPDVAPNGQSVVCTIQREDRRDLATMSLTDSARRVSPPEVLLSEPGVSFASPRWSPDGRWIVAERGTAQLVLIDPAVKRVVRQVAVSARGRSVSPAWMSDGSLLFASDREGGAFQIFRTNIETGDIWRLEDTGVYANSPQVSPDGRTLVFVGYTAAGHDLFSVPLDRARWTLVDSGNAVAGAVIPALSTTPQSSSAASHPYSPWRTLLPRFWTPAVESDNGEIVIGAATGSVDALGRHAYAAEGGWSARGRPDWQLSYAYARWRPTLFANVSDDTDPWRDGEVRTREANAGVLIPFRRVRWSQSILAAVHASTDRFTCSDCGVDNASGVTRSAVRAGWRFRTSRSYGYSISPETGFDVATTTEFTREALGADADSGAATVDLRGYVPFAPRHGVIAGRVAGATTWGDPRTRRAFSASGNGPQLGGFNFGSDAIGLLRGLSEDDIVGRHAVVGNLDYRFPIMRVDRGAGTLPIFARVLHGAVFADAGNAWRTTFRRQDVQVSVGAELSLDAVVGYVLPLTFTSGAAWVSPDRGFVAFARIGRAF